jgi:hypothetical protein
MLMCVTHRHAPSRSLPAGLAIAKLHDGAVISKASPCAQAGFGTALLLEGVLEGAN